MLILCLQKLQVSLVFYEDLKMACQHQISLEDVLKATSWITSLDNVSCEKHWEVS